MGKFFVVVSLAILWASPAYPQPVPGSGMSPSANNATLPDARTNLGLGILSVFDYGAKPSASAATNLSAFQAAAIAACATTGPAATVLVPDGQYNANVGEILIPCTGVSFVGTSNQGATLILTAGQAGNLFRWTQPVGQANGGFGSLKNLRIFHSGNPASGACITVDHSTRLLIENVDIDGCYTHIKIKSASRVIISHVNLGGANSNAGSSYVTYDHTITPLVTGGAASGTVLPFADTTGVYVNQQVTGTNIAAGSVVSSFVPNVSVTLSLAISGVVANGATITFTDNNNSDQIIADSDMFGSGVNTYTNGIVVGNVDGLAINNVHVGRTSAEALLIKPDSSASTITGVSCGGAQNPTFDVPGTNGIHIAALGGYTGQLSNLHFTSCAVNTPGGDGVLVDNTLAKGLTFTNVSTYNGVANGMNFQTGDNISVVGGFDFNNNTGNNAARRNVLVGGTTTNVTISGRSMTATGATHAVPYHIEVADTANHVVIGSNAYSGAGTGNVSVTTSGTDVAQVQSATDKTTDAWTLPAGNLVQGYKASVNLGGSNVLRQRNSFANQFGSYDGQWSADNIAFNNACIKSRATTPGTFATISASDLLCTRWIYADDGASYQNVGKEAWSSVGAVGAGSVSSQYFLQVAHQSTLASVFVANGSAQTVTVGVSGYPVTVPPSLNVQANYLNNGKLLTSATAPTIASGGCTTGSAQSISASSGTAAFEITLGGATCGSTITLTLPAASTNWVCDGYQEAAITNYLVSTGAVSTTAVVLTNTVRATGLAGNFTGATKYLVKCVAY